MTKLSFIIILLLANVATNAQSTALPYAEIGDYPSKYTPETMVARMIDGLGFRYYWATEGLKPTDLAFKPTPDSRTSEETIDHLLGLSEWILKPLKGEVNTRSGEETSKLPFDIKRQRTLQNLKDASDLLKSDKISVENVMLRSKAGEKIVEFPYWHEINGPIADALWHVGQVVSFRRSSGNPFDAKANVFMGKYMGQLPKK